MLHRDETNKILDRLREEQSRAKDEYQRWNLRYHNAREEKLKAVHNVETLNKLKDDRRKMDEQLENIEMDIEVMLTFHSLDAFCFTFSVDND